MPSFFVLDVPEFRPLVDFARGSTVLELSGPTRGYFKIKSDAPIRLERKALGFKPAVWHGSLTGGLVGTIEHFDNDVLVIGA